MKFKKFYRESEDFLRWVYEWKNNLDPLTFGEDFNPQNTAVLSVDMIKGFCYEGPLASERAVEVIEPIIELFRLTHKEGVNSLVLLQDAHTEDAREFESYPPHCTGDSSESDTVTEFTELSFFDEFKLITKNSINAALDTELSSWIEDHPNIDTFIVVGVCTDLCTYQLAMHLNLDANAKNKERRVVVPENCVETYDMPVKTAQEIDGIPHTGDLHHYIFLYHMMLNGVEIVSEINGN